MVRLEGFSLAALINDRSLSLNPLSLFRLIRKDLKSKLHLEEIKGGGGGLEGVFVFAVILAASVFECGIGL